MSDYQGSLLDAGEVASGCRFGDLRGLRRTPLSRGGWVDHLPAWASGTDAVFDELAGSVPWHADRRVMWEKEVAVPRLTKFYGTGEPLPLDWLADVREQLSDHYEPELGERFTSAGLCLYRDGSDSVAWHADDIGRGRHEDTMVAIWSLGSPRVLALRPKGGGPTTHRFALGHGDLLVMGGSCQRTWEHAVPKTAQPVGPRISVQFRPRSVR